MKTTKIVWEDVDGLCDIEIKNTSHWIVLTSIEDKNRDVILVPKYKVKELIEALTNTIQDK